MQRPFRWSGLFFLTLDYSVIEELIGKALISRGFAVGTGLVARLSDGEMIGRILTFKKISSNKKALISQGFAVGTGLEPATPCVTGTYSNQLNYHTM